MKRCRQHCQWRLQAVTAHHLPPLLPTPPAASTGGQQSPLPAASLGGRQPLVGTCHLPSPHHCWHLQELPAYHRHAPTAATPFKVVIKALSLNEIILIHVPNPVDRKDGSFLMRYCMYASVNEGLKIEILYGDKHVAQSPYISKGKGFLFFNILSCPSQEPQVTKDFTPFPTIDLQRMLEEVPARFRKARGAIVHFTILNNHIYCHSLGKYTDFKMVSDEILLSLARKVHLPAVEFYLNVGDWPVEHRKANDTPGPIPIISWCVTADLSVQGNTGPFWKNETERALFRGRDSREEHLELVNLSKEHPELLDAAITGYFFFQEKEKELRKAQLMGFFDFFKVFIIFLVLKQDSPYYEHFILKKASNLLIALLFIAVFFPISQENDEEARKIAKEGQLLARELLQPHRHYCYHYSIFQVSTVYPLVLLPSSCYYF
uniref:Protein O-glucosyltransferase 3 n=1 Tax=Crocodylus porosus TaxID=8502 RepID=A0A7M4F3P4_CROPO